MALGRVRSWFSKVSTRSETVAGDIPASLASHILAIEYWKNGATLLLSGDGLRLGRTLESALQLSQAVMDQAGWRGDRLPDDVAREVRAHCRAWFWIPPLRSRANPIDLEFFDSWPGNLLVSFHLKAPDSPKR